MNISELRQKLAHRKEEKKHAKITFTDSGGTQRDLLSSHQLDDPYWNSRSSEPSPFRASLRHHAEKAGRRVTPQAAQEVEAEGSKPSTGQLADFFESIDEAAERFSSLIPCAYCGASGTNKEGCCSYCAGVMARGEMTSAKVVHTAGTQLNLERPPHKIFIVDDLGVTRQHFIQQRTDGRTIINMDGQEVEV